MANYEIENTRLHESNQRAIEQMDQLRKEVEEKDSLVSQLKSKLKGKFLVI
jgi:hypothetical protein